MKKWIALLLSLVMLLSFAACSNDASKDDDSGDKKDSWMDKVPEGKVRIKSYNLYLDVDEEYDYDDSDESYIICLHKDDTKDISISSGLVSELRTPYASAKEMAEARMDVNLRPQETAELGERNGVPYRTYSDGDGYFDVYAYYMSGNRWWSISVWYVDSAGHEDEMIDIATSAHIAEAEAEDEDEDDDQTPATQGTTAPVVEDTTAPVVEDTTAPVVEEGPLSKHELGLYGQINDTNYVSIVLYDGDEPWAPNGPFAGKVILAVYDMGQTLSNTQILEDGFVKAASPNNFLYHFCVGHSDGLFSICYKNRYFFNGHIDFAPVESVNENYTQMGVSDLVVIREVDKSDTDENYIVGENWYFDARNAEDSVSFVYVKIGETDTDNIYACMRLETPVPMDDNIVTAMDEVVKNNAFKQTLLIMDDINDPSSITLRYGKEVNLSNTVEYHDLLAKKVEGMYGLTLKDPSSYLVQNDSYMKYSRYDEDGKLREVTFEIISIQSEYRDGFKEGVYEAFSNLFRGTSFTYQDAEGNEFEFMGTGTHYIFKNQRLISPEECTTMYEDLLNAVDSHFTYTDADGNTYDYFDTGVAGLFIFKNQKLMGVAVTNATDNFEGVSALFGVKP